MDGIDPNFVNALCPDDLDRVMPVLEERVQADARAGGGRASTPSSTARSPIRSTARRWSGRSRASAMRSASSACGRASARAADMAGCWRSRSCMARPDIDTWVIDPRRFTGHANLELCALKAVEDYQNEFRFHFPARTSPCRAPDEDHAADPGAGGRGRGVRRGQRVGTCRLYQAHAGFHETHSFRFNETFDVVARE